MDRQINWETSSETDRLMHRQKEMKRDRYRGIWILTERETDIYIERQIDRLNRQKERLTDRYRDRELDLQQIERQTQQRD